MRFRITSAVFKEGEFIPKKYACDGENVSPPLKWDAAPEGVKSFALINDDPDATTGTWVHWVMFNIPPDVLELTEKMPPEEALENGAKHGITDFGRVGYGGPCPPSGTHRYFFKLYALDTMLDLEPGTEKEELLEAMEGHILAEAQLIGKYKRQR